MVRDIWLLDNTILSNFSLAGKLELLKVCLGSRLRVSVQVGEEFKEGGRRGIITPQDIGWLKVVQAKQGIEQNLFQEFACFLGKGEASSLAIASNRHWKFLTDDLNARKAARREEVPVSGTIGLLVYLITIGAINLKEGNDILRKMLGKGYYSPVCTLDSFFK